MSKQRTPPNWLINVVIVAIVLVWVVNFGFRLFVQSYDPPSGLDALMLAVVGFLFAGKQAANQSSSSNDPPDRNRGEDT